MELPSDLPIMLFASAQEWDAWLDAEHAQAAGVWVRIAKKGGDVATVSYAEAVEIALCHGWIDGQVRKYDGACYIQRFTPRRSRSIWSQINTAKAEALIATGRMKQAGLREIQAAQRDGRWDAAYAAPSAMEVPEDFRAALDANPQAKVFFETLNKTNQYAIYFQLQTAKKPETRRARIEKFIAMLAEGEKLYP